MVGSKVILMLLFIFCIDPLVAQSGSIIINEIGRSDGLTDEDGDHVGWMELHNTSDSIVNFSGYYLTDSRFNLTKWRFPDGSWQIIEPHDYRIVYLSGKNRPDSLSAGVIQNHLSGYWPLNGSGVDYSTNKNDGLVNGPVRVIDRYGRTNGALQFDGNNDAVEFNPQSYLPLDSDFTISYWSNTTLSYRQHALSFGTAAGNNLDFDYADGNGLLTYWNGSGSNNIFTAGTTNELNDGKWHQIVLHRQNGLVRLFTDGQLRGTNYYTDSIASFNSFRVGRGSYYAGWWRGSLDDLFISDSAYYPSDIPTFRLHTNFNVSSSAVTLYLVEPDQLTIADSMYVHTLPEGVSVGRSNSQPDLLYYYTHATPGYENGNEGIILDSIQGKLYFNEVVTYQDSVARDEDGHFSPYVEIINKNRNLVDLSGIILEHNGSRWVFPDRIMLPGTRQIVWLDGKNRASISGELHSGFSITLSGGYLVLFRNDGVTVIDSVMIPNLAENESYSRIPEGIGAWNTMRDATPGAPNIKLWINEIQTLNGTGIRDDQNDRWPWLELYNNSHDTIHLENFYLSNDTTSLLKWQFPESMIPPFGFQLVQFSGRNTIAADGTLHANYTIDQSPQKFVISDSALVGRINESAIPFISIDRSYGSIQDGSETHVVFLTPTPRTSNTQDAFSSKTTSQSVEGVWQELVSNGPFTPRDGAAIIEFKGKLWLLGGWRGSLGVCSEVWSSIDGINWIQEVVAAPWSSRHTHGCVVYQDKIWLMSGDGAADVWNSSDGVNWSLVTNNPPWGKRYAPYVTVFNNEMYYMGGLSYWDINGNIDYSITRGFNDVWKSTDGINWTLVLLNAPWPERGLIHGRVIFDNKMWIMGGGIKNLSTGDISFNDIWYTSDGVSWTKVTDNAPWQKRNHFSVAVHDNKIWVTDGSALPVQQNLLNDTWYSPDGFNWFEVKSDNVFPVRHASSLGVFKDNLYLMCGYLHNDVWRFSFLKSDSGLVNFDSSEFRTPKQQIARIYNMSVTSEIIDSIKFSTNNFSSDNTSPLKINPQDSIDVVIEYCPYQLGIIADTATVYSKGGTARIAVSGIGTHTNHAPVFIQVQPIIAQEDVPCISRVYAKDVDSAYFEDTIRYHLISGPAWITLDTLTGILSGIPNASSIGNWDLIIEAYDRYGAMTYQTFLLQVFHRNHNPYWTSEPDTIAKEDLPFNSRIFARDQDSLNFGDVVHYQIMEGPQWLSIDSLGGDLFGTPPNNTEGRSVIIIKAYDQWAGISQKEWSLKILPTNYPPAFVDTAQSSYNDTITLFKKPVKRIFSWTPAKDPDTKDSLFYTFVLSGRGIDTSISGIRDTLVTVDESILWEQAHYEWHIYVTDGEFVVSSPDTFHFQTTKRVSNATYTETPKIYFLYQNYPNPFNPITTLRFQVPEESFVKIKVYNILGQLVQVVFKGTLGAKYYEMEWKPLSLASGIYFVKFDAESIISHKKFQSIKKMSYIK